LLLLLPEGEELHAAAVRATQAASAISESLVLGIFIWWPPHEWSAMR
jgi:hypothetical protein